VGKIAVHEFISLDGVFEDPKWTFEFGFDPKLGEALAAIMGSCEALLLGRRTFEMFAPAWSNRTEEDDPGAPFFNDSTKYVVGSTEPSVQWTNSTLVGGYDADAIRELKGRLEGDLYVSGSGRLVRSMLGDGLVDELHLMVFPIVLGKGKKLFADGTPPTKLTLASARSYDNGVVYLNHRPPA
jgi:dihydrofolate reductase